MGDQLPIRFQELAQVKNRVTKLTTLFQMITLFKLAHITWCQCCQHWLQHTHNGVGALHLCA
jgi:hypothetical protein